MLTMLVVDDEIYALKGITQGIDWSDLPIGAILEAENVDEAKGMLQRHAVDLVISDIEMPGANGLELLRHMKEAAPAALTIFLTGHARFDYAQEALHHGCFDYVLKPVDHDVLKEIVRRAVAEIEKRKEQVAFEETLDIYRRQWSTQLPILVERFWQEIVAGRLQMSPARLSREFELYGIPLKEFDRVLPVLLSIERWDVELDARDENIMEYAVRKAAAEIILGEPELGTVLQDRSELNVVLLYSTGGTYLDREQVIARCQQYVKACHDYFHCRVSCYVGEEEGLGELPTTLARLSQLERANISEPQTVIDAIQRTASPAGGSAPSMPSFLEWGILFDRGDLEELLLELERTTVRFQEEGASREVLELFYFGFAHMLLQAASRKGISIYDAVTAAELNEGQAVRSAQALQAWAAKLIQKAGQAFLDRNKDASAIIAKIQTFIVENIHQDLSRDDIAASVYRNPAYLSRLFRKETGLSLSDYIAQIKIERAKKLLTDTNDKISNIAEGLGYLHFSYFAKLFRKVTGLTPQEYRKKYQNV